MKRTLIGIKEVEKFDLYDITVENEHNFQLENGIIAHNSLFPKAIVAGGTGYMYFSNDVWIIGRQQEKDKTDIVGYNFIINIEKSRTVAEKSKIPVTVIKGKGIYKYSGLLELALESGHIVKPSNGWYSLPDSDKKYRESQTPEILDVVLNDATFNEFINKKFKSSSGAKLINDVMDIDDELLEDDVEDEDFIIDTDEE